MEEEAFRINSRTSPLSDLPHPDHSVSVLSMQVDVSTTAHSGFLHQPFGAHMGDLSGFNEAHPSAVYMLPHGQDDDEEHDEHCQHHGGGGHQHNHHHGGAHAGHQHGGQHHRSGPQRNYCVIFFVYMLIIGSTLLHIFAFHTIYDGFTRKFAEVANIFIQLMTFVTYTMTHTSNKNRPAQLLGKKNFQPRQHLDPIYDLSAKDCPKCNNFKFPRVSHCSSCRSCIYKMDHHCVWTQNCIGINNYKLFVQFVGYAFMGTVQFWLNCPRYFFWCLYQPQGFFSQGSGWFYLWWLIMAVSVGFMGIMISALYIGHVFMSLTNVTTLESMKSRACCPVPFFEWRKVQLSIINLFDRGEAKNMMNLFGDRLLLAWVPIPTHIENDILPQVMNPEPTRHQVLQWDEQLRKAEFEREHNMQSLVANVKQVMKGKKVRIGSEVLTL